MRRPEVNGLQPSLEVVIGESAARLESPSAVVEAKKRLPARAHLDQEPDGRDHVRSVRWPAFLPRDQPSA